MQKIVIEPDIPDFLNFSETDDEINDDDSDDEESDDDDIKIKTEFKQEEIVKESPLKRIKLENELSAESYLKSNVNITIRRITKPIKQEFQPVKIESQPIQIKKEIPVQKFQPIPVPVQHNIYRPTESTFKLLQDRKMLSLEQIEILRNINSTAPNLMRTPGAPEFKVFAMTLYYFSSMAYEHVREFCNSSLPNPQLILAWFNKTNGQPGFSKEAFLALTNLSKFNKTENRGKNLLFSMNIGELKLKSAVKFDETDGQPYGWINFGTNFIEGNCDLAENVFFILLTGVNNNYRIPIGYFFVGTMTGAEMASLIRLAVEFTAAAGIRTISLNFEQKSNYRSMTTSLGCVFNVSQFNRLKTYFEVRNARIYVFPEIYGILESIENCLKERKTIYYRKNSINFLFDEKNELEENFHTRKFWLNLRRIKEYFEIENFADKLKGQKERKEIYDFLQSMIKYFSRLKLSLNETDLIVKSRYKKGFIGLIVCLKSLFQIGLDFVRNRINAKNFPNFRLGQRHFNLFLNNFKTNNSTAYEFMTEYKKLFFTTKIKFSNEKISIFYNLKNSSIKNINTTTTAQSTQINLLKIDLIKKNVKFNKSYNISYLSTIVAERIIKKINCEVCHRFLIDSYPKNSKFSLKNVDNQFYYPSIHLLKICELINKSLIETQCLNRLIIIRNVFNKIYNLNIYKRMCFHDLNRFGLFDHDLLLIRTIIEVYLEVRCEILDED